MNILLKILPLFFLTSPFLGTAKEEPVSASGMTYEVRGQSFGQNMLAYIHAKWQSHINQIPLLFKPFPYANQMEMYKKEKTLGSRRYPKNITVKDENEIIYMDPTKTLYTVPYFPEVDPELVDEFPPPPYFTVLWEDQKFVKALRKMCEPTTGYEEIDLPKGRISIALHVRKGLPGEGKELMAQNPQKFPPHSYYVAQLQKLNEIFKNAPLYVYVFTDHKYPEKVAKALAKEVNLPNALFDCRKGLNNTRSHVVEDFYNMSRFMCLVRPESNYSLVAELIGKHAIVIKPHGGSVHIKVREK